MNGRDRRHARGEVGKRTARLWNRTIIAPETMPAADVPPEWAAEAPIAPERATAEVRGEARGCPACGGIGWRDTIAGADRLAPLKCCRCAE